MFHYNISRFSSSSISSGTSRKEKDDLERKREILKAQERREEREQRKRAEERDDAVLQSFFLAFEDLCAPGCTEESRENIVRSFFKQLPNCEAKTKLNILEIFSNLLERHPILLDDTPYILELVVDMIITVAGTSGSSDVSVSLQCKLFHIVGLICNSSLHLRGLNWLLMLFRGVIMGSVNQSICPLLVSALKDATLQPPASAGAVGGACPANFLHFSGRQSALVLPEITSWPAPKSYSVCLWLRWNHTVAGGSERRPQMSSVPGGKSASTGVEPKVMVLYSFLSAQGRGVELCLDRNTGEVLLTSVSAKQSMELKETGLVLEAHRWHFLTITHCAPQSLFSRSAGRCFLSLGGVLKTEIELLFPNLSEEVLTFCAIGASLVPSPRSNTKACLYGQLGGVYFFKNMLSAEQTALIFRNCHNFSIRDLLVTESKNTWFASATSSITSFMSVIGGGGPTAGSAPSSGPVRNYSSPDAPALIETCRSLFFLYHPQCAEGLPGSPDHVLVDLSPLYHGGAFLNAKIANTRVCSSRDVRDVVHCSVGGVRTFLPLFYYMDVLSTINGPEYSADASQRLPSMSQQGSFLPLTLQLIGQMLTASHGNQCTMLDMQGFPCLGYILSSFVSPAQITPQAIAVIEQLVFQLSWLDPALSKECDAPLQQRHFESPSSAGSNQLNPALAVDWARKNTLFNVAWLNLLFQWRLWMRIGVPFAVQLDAAEAVRTHIRKLPRYFREFIGVQRMLDVIRNYLSYQNSPLLAVAPVISVEKGRPRVLRAASSGQNMAPLSRSRTNRVASDGSASEHLPRDGVSRIAVLRHIRELRQIMLTAVRDMILLGNDSVQAEDIGALLACAMESADALHVADVLELLANLLATRPDQIFPALVRMATALCERKAGRASAAGASEADILATETPGLAPQVLQAMSGPGSKVLELVLAVLSRLGRWEHIQLASVHLLGNLLRAGPKLLKAAVLSESDFNYFSQCSFLGLRSIWAVLPFFRSAYCALMEIIVDVAAGTFVAAHATALLAPASGGSHRSSANGSSFDTSPPLGTSANNLNNPNKVGPSAGANLFGSTGGFEEGKDARPTRRVKGLSTRRGRPRVDSNESDVSEAVSGSQPAIEEESESIDVTPHMGQSKLSGQRVHFSEGIEMLLALCEDKCQSTCLDTVSALFILEELQVLIVDSTTPVKPGVDASHVLFNRSKVLEGPLWQLPLLRLFCAHAARGVEKERDAEEEDSNESWETCSVGSLKRFLSDPLAVPVLPGTEVPIFDAGVPLIGARVSELNSSSSKTEDSGGGFASLKNFFFSSEQQQAQLAERVTEEEATAFFLSAAHEKVAHSSSRVLTKTVAAAREACAQLVAHALVYSKKGWLELHRMLCFLTVSGREWNLTERAFNRLRRELLHETFNALSLMRVWTAPADTPAHLVTNYALAMDLLEEIIYVRPSLSLGGSQLPSPIVIPASPVQPRRSSDRAADHNAYSDTNASDRTEELAADNDSGRPSQKQTLKRLGVSTRRAPPRRVQYSADSIDANAESDSRPANFSDPSSSNEGLSASDSDLEGSSISVAPDSKKGRKGDESSSLDRASSGSSWVGVQQGGSEDEPATASFVFSAWHMTSDWRLARDACRAASALLVPLRPFRSFVDKDDSRGASSGFLELFSDSVSSPLAVVRRGGPLRVVLRLLLDAVSFLPVLIYT
jgi:hypothetical protein